MAAFEYVALKSDGGKVKGVITAVSARAARADLRVQGLSATKISELAEAEAGRSSLSRAKLSEKARALMVRQFAVLLQSGLTLDEALSAAAGEEAKPGQKRILAGLREEIGQGASLAAAMATAPQAFSPMVRAVTAAGEASGKLDEVFERLATYLEANWQLKQKVRAALIYPALLTFMALGMLVALMVFVVPRLVEQFDTFDADLPMLTKIVIGISDFLQNWGLVVLVLCIVGVVALVWFSKQPRVKRQLDQYILNVPIIGNMTRTVSAARFARIFATLSASGATVLEALQAAKGAMTNQVFVDAADSIAAKIQTGGAFAPALKATGVFPPMMGHMVASGEMGRDISAMMVRSADFLEAEFETATQTALSLMEPLVIVVLGGFVGMVVLSIMLPIVQLNTLAFA